MPQRSLQLIICLIAMSFSSLAQETSLPDSSAGSETSTAGLPEVPQNSGETPADSDASDESPQAEVAASPDEQLADAQQRFLDYYSAQQYQLAAVAAGQTVDLAGRIYGQKSISTGLALANLATAQSALRDFRAALANYEASIYIIEDIDGLVSPRLVNPLLGLAATHNSMGAYDRSLRAYNRALRINHVDKGLFNPEQMKIRDGLTESYIGLDDMDKAGFQQEVQLDIARRNSTGELNDLLPAIYKLADWYRRAEQPLEEQQQYWVAINVIRQTEGADSVRQIEPMQKLATAYGQIDDYAAAIRLLKQAYRISEEAATPDPLRSADILVQLGDNFNIFDSYRDARSTYITAWNILTKIDKGQDYLDSYFGEPTRILTTSLPTTYPDNAKTRELYLNNVRSFQTGHVNMSFDVNESGRVKNVRVLESHPEKSLEKRLEQLLYRQRYRPRMDNGETVATEDMLFSHSFKYRNENKDKETEAAAESERLEFPGS